MYSFSDGSPGISACTATVDTDGNFRGVAAVDYKMTNIEEKVINSVFGSGVARGYWAGVVRVGFGSN